MKTLICSVVIIFGFISVVAQNNVEVDILFFSDAEFEGTLIFDQEEISFHLYHPDIQNQTEFKLKKKESKDVQVLKRNLNRKMIVKQMLSAVFP